MTPFDWTLLIVALLALGYLGIIAWKKAPQLSIVDPMSSREAQARERKNALLEERMRRQVEERGRTLWKSSILPVFIFIRDGFRRLAGKLTALERRYVEKQRGGVMDASALHAMIVEAKTAIAQERFDVAEERLIAVVSHDPKNVEAYETLGRMYLERGQYAEAKESFEFLVKLAPKDASVLVSLGEVHDAMGDKAGAFTYYKKGKDVSPNNPKYLDFFIEAALDAKEFHEAQVAIDHLREVNPDNQKIADFESRLSKEKHGKKETK